MVNLRIVEDRPTPKEVYGWRPYFCASIACWASILIGYDSAFIGSSIALGSFKGEFGLDTARSGFLSANIVSCYQAGCFFGALAGYTLGYYFGRRWGMFIACIIFIVGGVLQTVASASTGLGIMYAGRVIAGLGVGICSNLSPIYLAEISPPAIRGRLIGIYELGWQIGAVIGFWVPYAVALHIAPSMKQWRVPFGIQIIPGGMLALGCFILTESPRWLASRRHPEKALKNLAWLRNLPADHPYVVEELTEIEAAIQSDEAHAGPGIMGPLKTLFASKKYLYRLSLALMLFAMQNGTGAKADTPTDAPTIFKSIGISGTNTGLLTTGIFGIVKFAAALVWLLWLVDNVGRKPLLIGGSAGGAFCMYWIAIYIAVAKPAEHPSTKLSSGGTSALVAFYLWTAFYGPTWNGTPWVFGAEVMPTFIRAATQALIAASNWLFAFLISRFTPQMFKAMGFGVYLFFASLMVLSIPIVYLVIPETSGVPLESMDELFALPPRKAHGIVTKQLAQQHAERTELENGKRDEAFDDLFVKGGNNV